MALREPRDVLHKGKRLDEILEAHGRWLRNEEGGVRADLAGAKLFGVRLREAHLALANFLQADLHRTDFQNADLDGAELSECDLRECDFSGGDLTKCTMARAQLHRARFRHAQMTQCILDGSDLVGTDLRGARLEDASAAKTRFFQCDLRGSLLARAQFAEAELVESNLGAAALEGLNLSNAKILGSDFRGADLTGVELRQAKFQMARFGHTRIGQCDLGPAMGLETSLHFGPTWLDADTLARSEKSLPAAFLYGAGISVSQAKGQSAPMTRASDTRICLIAYSKRDAEFAERLRTDLMANGLRCWLMPEDARWDGIDLGRAPYDQLLLICSRQSLVNKAVLRETWAGLEQDRRAGGGVLFPLRIDDFVVEGWEHERKAELLEKPIGDFRNWKDGDLYGGALEGLLGSLRRPPAPPVSGDLVE